jgi:hypothetical protein
MLWKHGHLIFLHIFASQPKYNKTTTDSVVVSFVQVKKGTTNSFSSVTRIKTSHSLHVETSSILSKRFVC